MRKWFAGLIMVAMAGAFGSLYAQTKIGVINSQDVLERSAEGKKIIARIQERDKQYQAEIAKMDDDIRQLQTRLNTQRLTLTDEAAGQLQADLERKSTDRKRRAEDALAGMQELTNRLFQKIQAELIPIVEQLGKERGMDMIFDLQKSGAAWVNPVIDLSNEIIKRYDASKAVPAK